MTAYKERLQRAAFLRVDPVRAFEGVIASQCFHRHRRRQHAIRLTRRLHARSDVNSIAPDVVGELAVPITPAITGPECSPTRIAKGAGKRDRNRPVAVTSSRANFVAIRAWLERGVGTPATAM